MVCVVVLHLYYKQQQNTHIMKKFNSYKLVWGVEVTKKGKVKFHPHFSAQTLNENLRASKGSTVYVITDKQFGMIQNSWNGVESKLPKPFKRKLVNKDGSKIQVIPLTENQYNTPIHV